LVQPEQSGLSFPLSRWHFLANFLEPQQESSARTLFIVCENQARFVLEAEFITVRYFFFAPFAVSFVIFAVKIS